MYHSTKSDVIHCIEREAEAVSHGATETDTQQQHDCVVQDDGQLVHQLDARGTGTFEQFTQRLCHGFMALFTSMHECGEHNRLL